MAGGLLGGVLVDRWGVRRVIRVSLAGVSFSLLLVGCAGVHFPIFIAAIALAGIFRSPLGIAINKYLGQLFPAQQRRVISLNLASTSMGGILYPLVAEWLLHLSRTSSRVSFAQVLHIPFFVVSIFLAAASFIYRPRHPAAGRIAENTRRNAAKISSSQRGLILPFQAVALGALIAFHGVFDSTLHIWMARFLESSSFERTLISPGVVLSCYAVSYVLSRILLALLPDKTGRRLLLVLPGLAGGSVMILAILSRNYLLTATGYVLGALLWSAEFPSFVSAALRRERRRFGSLMAVTGIIGGVAAFLMLNAIGLAVQRLGDSAMWLVMLVPASGFVLVGLGGLLWTLKYDDDAAPSETNAVP